MRKVLLYVILVAALCLPVPAGAFGGDDLNLTDEQKAQLKEIWTEAEDEIKPLVEELKGLRDEMEEVILSVEVIDTGEGSDASLLSEELIGVRTKIMEIKADAKLKAANVLTLEQRKVMVEKRKNHRKRREQRREAFGEYREGADGFPGFPGMGGPER